MSEYIPRSHAVISPRVQLGTLTDFERKGLFQDGEPVGKRGESGPRSANSELITQPARALCGGLCGAIE